ncbi:bcl-2-interacting killer isoform X1 [Phoca vitulina]|uniref:bcl-2-interacting killer isoform X1 n=2 Tax=Phoca vitulina TaxID=9720 RepID=UPI0013964A9D|nr:bcl-2-interacting killer isoform X1 [Phoca vitulina]
MSDLGDLIAQNRVACPPPAARHAGKVRGRRATVGFDAQGLSQSVSLSPREEMSHPGPLSRNLSWSTFLREHGPEVLEVPGTTDLMEYYDPGPSPNSTNPDDVAMRLAFIGDEMEVRWMLPRFGELPGTAMYSLAFTYNQTGLRGVLRSFMDGLSNLRESIRIWSFLTFRNRVNKP